MLNREIWKLALSCVGYNRDLFQADMSGINLNGANFTDASLAGVDLRIVSLQGAILNSRANI